jgi:hypothetical protein
MNDAATMPFGKYTGKSLTGIPKAYLKWVIENCNLRPLFRAQLQAVLDGNPIPTESTRWGSSGDNWHLSDSVLHEIEAMFAEKLRA